jgi:hypothetical protein
MLTRTSRRSEPSAVAPASPPPPRTRPCGAWRRRTRDPWARAGSVDARCIPVRIRPPRARRVQLATGTASPGDPASAVGPWQAVPVGRACRDALLCLRGRWWYRGGRPRGSRTARRTRSATRACAGVHQASLRARSLAVSLGASLARLRRRRVAVGGSLAAPAVNAGSRRSDAHHGPHDAVARGAGCEPVEIPRLGCEAAPGRSMCGSVRPHCVRRASPGAASAESGVSQDRGELGARPATSCATACGGDDETGTEARCCAHAGMRVVKQCAGVPGVGTRCRYQV